MSVVTEVFAEHGITISEDEIADLVRESIDETPNMYATGLPPDEAALYDAAGLSEDAYAYRTLRTATAASYVTLVGTSLSVVAAAARLELSRPRIQQMIRSRQVWALRGRTGNWMLPRIQFDGGALLPGWTAVAHAIPERTHPLEVLGVLTTPQPELDRGNGPVTVADWLRSGGDVQRVVAMVSGLAETGL